MGDEETIAAIKESIAANIRDGLMEQTGVDTDGQPTYRLTEAGIRQVESMPLPDQQGGAA